MSTADRRAYFAYGSNTVREVMRDRAPEASFVCFARLDGFKWSIATCGYGTVIPANGRSVYGLLWCITAADEFALDLVEGVGVPEGYVKRRRTVVTQCGREVEALVYESLSRRIGRDPMPGYIEDIIAALSGDEFVPQAYLLELRAWLR